MFKQKNEINGKMAQRNNNTYIRILISHIANEHFQQNNLHKKMAFTLLNKAVKIQNRKFLHFSLNERRATKNK